MKGGIGWNLRISGVERYLYDIYLMFLSREIDIKLCQIYTKIHIYAILYKSCRFKQIISGNTKPIWKTWKSQVCFCNNYQAPVGYNRFRLVSYLLNMICLMLQLLYKIAYIWIFAFLYVCSCMYMHVCSWMYMYVCSTPEILRFHPTPPFIFPWQSL